MNAYTAHLSAVEPNDTTLTGIDIRFTAGDEHEARETARQFTDRLNEGPFAGFVLTGVDLVHGVLVA